MKEIESKPAQRKFQIEGIYQQYGAVVISFHLFLDF